MLLLHQNEGALWLLIIIQCFPSLKKRLLLPNVLIKYDNGKHYLLSNHFTFSIAGISFSTTCLN